MLVALYQFQNLSVQFQEMASGGCHAINYQVTTLQSVMKIIRSNLSRRALGMSWVPWMFGDC